MSKYTTEVRFICETIAGEVESKGYNDVEDILDESWDKIFNTSFPIFDETYRETLCKKILRHFYTREIGMETVGLWKLRLNTKMMEIMPYYNKLYTAWSAQFNPLHDIDLSREHTLDKTENRSGVKNASGERNTSTSGTQNTNTETDNVNRDAYSDTPQGALTNVENNTYLTNARKVTDDFSSDVDTEFSQSFGDEFENEETTTNEMESNDEFAEHVFGKTGGTSYSKMLKEYEQSLINIDMMVIGELENLFMMIW